MEEKIEQAIIVLKQGGVVMYPTDTAFGIGCRVDDEGAVRRLFAIRKRPESQATPVLVESLDMAKRYWTNIPSDVEEQLIKTYWPGALTIVLQCKTEKIPELVRGGTETLGLRMPDHTTTLSLINGLGVPLLGPSANFHGKSTPYSVYDLDSELVKRVDFVVSGECTVKQASTVVDCTVKPWQVLRQGAIKI